MENATIKTEENLNQVEAAEQMPSQQTTEQNKPNGDIGYGIFLGSELLMSLPLVGLVSSIVMAIVSKKKSFKNYALAKMTWLLVKGVLSIATALLIFSIVGNIVVGTINSSFGTQFDDVYQFVGTAVDLSRGKYSSSVAQLENTAPDNLKAFVKELGNGQYEEILQFAKNEEYSTLLEEFKSDKYPELINKLDKETYDSLIKELEKAANGEILPWMEDFKNITENGILSFING